MIPKQTPHETFGEFVEPNWERDHFKALERLEVVETADTERLDMIISPQVEIAKCL